MTLRAIIWCFAAWPLFLVAYLWQPPSSGYGAGGEAGLLVAASVFALLGNAFFGLLGVLDGIGQPQLRLRRILEPLAIPLVTWSLAVVLLT